MRISILTATDPLVRSIAALSLSDACHVLTVDLDDDGTHLTYSRGFEQTALDVPLAHSCVACSIREAVIPFLMEENPDRVIVALPIAVESSTIVPALSEQIAELGWYVSSVAHVCDLAGIAGEMLSHIPLASRGLALSEDDHRCVGEVQMINIGYADIVLATGTDSFGLELMEHFRPHDSLLAPALDEVDGDLLFEGRHCVERALDRVHPATTAAWGGPDDHGVWTLDLISDRAFHPERLIDSLSALCDGEVCVRGCFWLPSRPGTVCAVNAHGGSVIFGSAGEWPDSPMAHLIVTGTGNGKEAIEEIFGACLLSPEEEAKAFAWVGASDGLEDYFG